MESQVAGQVSESFDPEIQSFFQECSQKLDQIHDRHERLVKISRDITIDSKVNYLCGKLFYKVIFK